MARRAKRKSTWYDAFLDVGIWILFVAAAPPRRRRRLRDRQGSGERRARDDRAGAIRRGRRHGDRDRVRARLLGRRSDRGAEGRVADERRHAQQPALLAARRDRHRQRQGPQGRLDDRPQGLRCRRQVLGRGSADRLRGDDVRPDRRRRRLRGRRRHRQDSLGVPGAPRADDQHGVLRLALARRRARRRQGLHRPPGREARRARPADRQGRLGDGRRALAGRVHAHARAALLRRHGDRGRLRRRVLAPRPRHRLRRQDGQAEVAASGRSQAPARPATTRGPPTPTPGRRAAPRSGRRRPSIPSSACSTSPPATPRPT